MARPLRFLLVLISLALIPIIFSLSWASDLHTVKRVIDGDTLLLANGERVRLIGVDTPEVHESDKLHRDALRTYRDIQTIRRLGQMSSAFVKKLVKGSG